MLNNLSHMIDVERAECAVRADYDREMDAVRNGEGVETVNKRVAGAVKGGMASAQRTATSRSTRPCAARRRASLRALPRDRVEIDDRSAAAAGGRHVVVEELVARGVVDRRAREVLPAVAARRGRGGADRRARDVVNDVTPLSWRPWTATTRSWRR